MSRKDLKDINIHLQNQPNLNSKNFCISPRKDSYEHILNNGDYR